MYTGPEKETIKCPMCDAHHKTAAVFIGWLGIAAHFRCTACNWVWSIITKRETDDE